jgi:hypothetical protein
MNTIRTNYCSLKDAFKTPNFTQYEEPQEVIPEVKTEVQPYSQPIIEKFDEVSCETIHEHMKHCKECSGSRTGYALDIAFNDILNMLLLIFLMWIIIYKPSI